MFGFGFIYTLAFYQSMRQDREQSFRISLTRAMSRFTGRLCNYELPESMRPAVYKGFGKFYGVNFDEIKVDDLRKFRSFNQFFTRQLKHGARAVDEPQNLKNLCSPCDGTILSFGDVHSKYHTFDCIKGRDYRMDEFLYGIVYQKAG